MKLIIDEKTFLLACANKCMGTLEVTKQAGVASNVLHRISHGECVRVETVGKLAKALGLNPIELLKEE